MLNKKNFIDQFFMKFSYSSKTKFIYVLGNIPLIILVIMLYSIIYKPLKNVELQSEGAAYLKELSLLFENVSIYILKESSLSKDIDIKVYDQIIKLEEEKNSWIHNLKKNQKIFFDEFKIDLKVFQDSLSQLEGDGGFQTSREELLLAYNNILIDIGNLFDLMNSYPGELRGLVFALIKNLPRVQFDLFDLLRNDNEINFEGSHELLKNDLESLKQNVLPILEWINTSYPKIKTEISVEQIEKLSQMIKNIISLREEIPILHLALNTSSDLKPLYEQALELTFSLHNQLNNILENSLKIEYSSLQRILLLCLFAFFIGEGSVTLIFFNRVFRHPVHEIVERAKALAKGNLSVRINVTSQDEVGQLALAFNCLADYHEKILKKATEIIIKIFQASSKIADLAKIIETNMTIQEQMINQIAHHSKAIQTDVKEYACVIDNVNRDAAVTSTMVQQGHLHLNEMESVMHEMLNAVSNVVHTLSSLQEKITDINKVISTIVKIADQSNLLSLNTAIRAKKSGVEGRGFVVIADKIREMADQIASATLDIEQSVTDIFGSVQTTVAGVEEFSSQILNHFEESKAISDQLKQLIDSTQQQVQDFEKINQGMQCQTQQEEAINTAINDLETNIQGTAFSVHKLYLEIEYLHDASQNLHEKTKQFTFSSTKE